MRKSRGIASLFLALAAVGLLVAGPVMVVKGVQAQDQIRHELRTQKIVFPEKGSSSLPAGFESYAGQQVTTGPQAKAYADMVEHHVMKSTGGLTYSEVSDKWIAGGRTDNNLAQLRQTAFMGESLRASLMSAYQAWELSWLVIGLGGLFFGLAIVFGTTAYALRPERIKVPVSPEALESRHLQHN